MALNQSALSPQYTPSPFHHSTNPPRFQRPSLKLPFLCIDHPNLVVGRAQINKSGSEDIVSDPNIDGFGPKKAFQCDGDEGASSSSAIDFLTLCHSLKTTKRKGWINHGIEGPESIADHMYRMALMSLIAGDNSGVNRERCIKLALVHDIAEAIVGDITPSDGVPKVEKSRMEQAALNEMCKVLGGGMRADEIQELWAEYENNSSIEANLVKDFDKVEMILQALEYETEHGMVLDEFFVSTAGKFQTDIGKSWAAEIISRRKSSLTS
ncbi:hypothetical protein DCAR_0832914 [Daucus carota subsp. sativus]|uniref:5'-deoxynucleotidase n=1 Tax=Daucus carota subsp. sativus TaxID=79200 RepID=A0AAF0XV59_DAUCS|nr:PREDICTED: HD domain-containing protein 2 homolog [Daucus carota subsp. sativus]WOH13404.1 hypothetical protein DCAR_0832914 [Daucus carota subsp. sativus]